MGLIFSIGLPEVFDPLRGTVRKLACLIDGQVACVFDEIYTYRAKYRKPPHPSETKPHSGCTTWPAAYSSI